ncbi:hypothetical protein GmHk_09G026233 [Glycine max]|nr:hypothetical protein GmHk_09G026233 [Glycine max]
MTHWASLRHIGFSDQRLSETHVTITEEMETISKRFQQLDVYGKIHLKSKLREIVYPDMNSMYPPLEKVKTKGAPKKPLAKQQKSTKRDPSYWEYVDALHSVQNNGNCGYHAIVALLGVVMRPLSFTTSGVAMEYTLSFSGKAVAHSVHS